MRIGIDGSCLANRRGFGRFARRMTQALADAGSDHEFVVFVDRPSAEQVAIPDGLEQVIVDVSEAPTRAASSQSRRSIPDMVAMGRAAARSGLDVMYFPASYSFFPVWGVGRTVVTMHDTLALARPELVFPNWKGRVAWALKEHAAVHWADRIITVSESARRDLIAWFKLPEDRVDVVTEGPDPVFQPRPRTAHTEATLQKYGIKSCDSMLLYVGGLSPHKNLLRLIEAYAQSGLAGRGARLVLVGDMGDVFHTHVPELREAIARWGLADSAVFTGFVPDGELAELYNQATALVQPSLMEGFGLPPIEAMACGTPVLASRAGSLPEVVGEAGILFDPTNVAEIAQSLRAFWDDPELRTRLAGQASLRASRFTWRRAAALLLESLERLEPRGSGSRRKSA